MSPDAGGTQAAENAAVWERGEQLDHYANRDLRPVEATILLRHRRALEGRVLELGTGGGRVTGYLVELAAELHGIDIAPDMVDYCRRAYPAGEFQVADLTDLSRFGDGSFDAVLATFNVLDVLDDAQRGAVLDELHRLIAPGGMLVFSTHNRGAAANMRRPAQLALSGNPVRVALEAARVPRRVRNRRRLAARQEQHERYAVLNDEAHDFSLLHYYIGRDAQERQLAEHGFELIECLALDGRTVGPGESAPDCPELHYVARRSG